MHLQDSANLLMMPDYIAQIMLLQHQSFCGRIKVIPITAVDPEAIKFLERLGTLNAEDLLMHFQDSANLLMMPDYIAQIMLLQHQSFCGGIKVIPIKAVDPGAIKFLERLGTLNAEADSIY